MPYSKKKSYEAIISQLEQLLDNTKQAGSLPPFMGFRSHKELLLPLDNLNE